MKYLKNKTFLKIVLFLSAFACTLVFAEFSANLFSFERTHKNLIFRICYRPYLGFINGPNSKGKYTILNQFSDKLIEGYRTTNNWGFREDVDYSYFSKKPEGTKVILILGGSAVGGAGSTADSTVIDASLEKKLNEKSKTKFVVYNFGNGGWVSFQEILGAILFGFYLEPDFIILMNGRNDVAVGIDSREGPLAFKHNAVIESYLKGYLEYGMNTSFYRGEFENWIIKKSKLYRTLSGRKYIPKIQTTFQKHEVEYVGTRTSWADLDTIIKLYIKNIEVLEKLFPKTKIIASLQPLCHQKHEIFKDVSADEIHEQTLRGSNITYHTAIRYFYISLVGKKTPSGTKIIYAGEALPAEFDPQKYFLDEAHLTDAGVELVADYYKKLILSYENK